MITQEDAIQLFRYNNKHIDELSNEDRIQIADWIEKLQKYEQSEETVRGHRLISLFFGTFS